MTSQQMPIGHDSPDDDVLTNTAKLAAQQARTLALHIAQHSDMEAQEEQYSRNIAEKIFADLQSAQEGTLRRAASDIEERQAARFQNELATALGQFNTSLRDTIQEHEERFRRSLQAMEETRQNAAKEHSQQMQEIRSLLEQTTEDTRRHQRELEESHKAVTEEATRTIQNEREEQRAEYEKLRSDTTANIQEMTATALKEHSGSIQTQLEENARETQTKLEESSKATQEKFTETEQTIQAQRSDTDTALARSEAKWLRITIATAGGTAIAAAVAAAALVIALT